MTRAFVFALLLAAALGFTPPAAQAAAPAAAASSAPAARVIVLVRHGNYVEDKKIPEDIGPPLSPIGVAQAKLAAARIAGMGLHFDVMRVSPMQRARDTAAVIAADLPGRAFRVDPDLHECIPPTWRTEITQDLKPSELADCKAQFDRLFDRYFHPARGHVQSDLLVCHGDVIRYLVTRALGVDTMAWLEMSVRNASITEIRVEPDGRFKVISVGDDGFMPANLLTGATGDPERSLAVPPLPVER